MARKRMHLATDRSKAALRRAARGAAIALTLALVACHSREEKANRYEAVYDAQLAGNAVQPAMMSIQRAVAYDDAEPRRWLKLARVQQMLDMPAAAAVSFQHALDLQPANIEALENLAVLAVRGGQYDNARRYLDPLMVLQPDDVPGLLVSGAIALYEHRYPDADQIAGKLIANAPDRSDGYVMRARVYDATYRTRDAIKLLEDRLKIDPTNSDILLQLMEFYRKLGDRGGIRATAIRLMPLYPDDPRYALESARAYHDEGKADLVHSILDGLVQRFARNPEVMTAVAQFWRDYLPADDAKNAIAGAAENASPRVRVALSNMLTNMGDPSRAADILAPLAPPQVTVATIDGQAAYARALFQAGRIAEAKPKIDQILGIDFTNPTAMLLRARLALARHDYASALTDAQGVTTDDDSNQEAALLVAQIYAAMGNQILAAKAFGTARQNFPDSAYVLLQEAEWLFGQKRGAEAAQRAIAFAHAHERQTDAWLAARDVCTRAGNTDCATEARDRLKRFG